jgi:hypothetical protein
MDHGAGGTLDNLGRLLFLDTLAAFLPYLSDINWATSYYKSNKDPL